MRAPKKLVLLELKTAGEKEIQAWKDAQVEIAVANALQGTVAASDMKATVELLTRICTHVRRKHEEINAYLDIIERGEIKRLKAVVMKAEGEA